MLKFMLWISMPSPCSAPTISAMMAPIKREDHRDLEAGEDEGQCVRQLQHPEDLAARGRQRPQQVDPVLIRRAQADDGVHHQREERDERRKDDLRVEAEPEPHDDQRGECDLRQAPGTSR